jgi:hypothetical protein
MLVQLIFCLWQRVLADNHFPAKAELMELVPDCFVETEFAPCSLPFSGITHFQKSTYSLCLCTSENLVGAGNRTKSGYGLLEWKNIYEAMDGAKKA